MYSDAADAVGERKGFLVVCESLNHFLITLCLQGAVMGSYNLGTVWTNNILEKTLIEEKLEPLWLGGYYVFNEPSHNFYVSRNRDVLVMNYGDIWVGSPHALKDIIQQDIGFQLVQGD